MTKTIYYTASSLDGFIAGPGNDLEWLVSGGLDDGPEDSPFAYAGFEPSVGVRFYEGSVADLHGQLAAAAGDRDVWVVGGGDLAGQFLDAGLLDEVVVSFAPVTLGAGAPLLPRRADWRLRDCGRMGDFACARWEVARRA